MGDERTEDFRDYRRHGLGLDDRTRVIGTLAAREREEQTRNLERVSSAIGRSILAFFSAHSGQTFFADEIRQHVARECGPRAPASADRIMRQLKSRNELNYEVVNRARSLYQILPVRPS